MKFRVKWATPYDREAEEMEINTLEDLKALYMKERESLIIDFEKDPSIWVYNGYME